MSQRRGSGDARTSQRAGWPELGTLSIFRGAGDILEARLLSGRLAPLHGIGLGYSIAALETTRFPPARHEKG